MAITAPARLGEALLPDGRLLGWAEWGPSDGTPVLLSPGAATSRRLGFGADCLAALGIRLVSMDRPGLGASSPHPPRGFPEFAADVRHLAEALGLARPAMVASSQGAPFALAAASAGAVCAVAVVSGADEVASPTHLQSLPDDLQRLVRLVLDDPIAAELQFAGFTPEAMLEMVLSGSPECDLAVYTEPRFRDAYCLALREGFAQGTDGYARDTVLAMGRWGIDLGSIAVPVDLWYGAHDRSHSPDHGASLARRIPGARRTVVPDAGGALLWTHAELILRALRERVEVRAERVPAARRAGAPATPALPR
ncbi:alpha/beta fold hydrolase [Motilibacter aurantiacus]|uniref:alpha/beta fold hydrolase n=1 Tax=Motilibacter aurantiacus TaxID=2714955 RepID=UPI0014096112|nr:alpha/beta hydrolase [Motilibacter aurantiacus]